MSEFPALICDERVGCVAVYQPPKVNCMDELPLDKRLYYANGELVRDDKGVHWTVPAEKIAWGRLFAAAPELLEAAELGLQHLERAMPLIERDINPVFYDWSSITKLRAVIAKAKGQQP